MKARRVAWVLTASDGVSSPEYAIVLAMVALVALGAWTVLGENVEEQIACAAGAIRGSEGRCTTGEAGDGGAGAASASQGLANERSAEPRGRRLGAMAGARASLSVSAATNGTTTEEDRYLSRFERSLDDLDASFPSVAGDDGRMTRADLERVLDERTEYDPRVVEAATFLSTSPSAMNALDIGAGRHAIDGEISLDDIRAMRRDLAGGGRPLYQLLADGADGRGGRDRQWSEADLEALANDRSVPLSVRRAARDAKPNATHHCGGWRIDCHIAHGVTAGWNAATSGWHAAGKANAVLGRVTERMGWMVGQLPPLYEPWKLDDWAEFKLRFAVGAGKWVLGMSEAVGAGVWWMLTDRRVDDWGRVWAGMRSIPVQMWANIEAFAGEDPGAAGEAAGSLAMDGASFVVPGGTVLRLGRVGAAARVGRVPRAVETVLADAQSTEAKTLLRELGDSMRKLQDRPLTTEERSAIDAIVRSSPSLAREMGAIERDHWTIRGGTGEGVSSYTSFDTKRIGLHPDRFGDEAELAGVLAEEVNHAFMGGPSLGDPLLRPREQYVREAVSYELRLEATALLRRFEVASERAARNRPTRTVEGLANPEEYGPIYRDYLVDHDRARAIARFEDAFHRHERDYRSYTDWMTTKARGQWLDHAERYLYERGVSWDEIHIGGPLVDVGERFVLDPAVRGAAQHVPLGPGTAQVYVQRSWRGFSIGGRSVSARELANELRARGFDDEATLAVDLVCPRAANRSLRASAAQELADALGKPVRAPTDVVTVADGAYRTVGEWRVFRPRGKR